MLESLLCYLGCSGEVRVGGGADGRGGRTVMAAKGRVFLFVGVLLDSDQGVVWGHRVSASMRISVTIDDQVALSSVRSPRIFRISLRLLFG